MANIRTMNYEFVNRDDLIFDETKIEENMYNKTKMEVKIMVNEQLYNDGYISEEMYRKAREVFYESN